MKPQAVLLETIRSLVPTFHLQLGYSVRGKGVRVRVGWSSLEFDIQVPYPLTYNYCTVLGLSITINQKSNSIFRKMKNFLNKKENSA